MDAFEGSALAFSNHLDLFNLPSTDAGILNSEYFPHFPLTSYSDNENPITFIIPSSTNLYTDLKNSFLYLRLKILKTDNSNLTSSDGIAGCHNMYAALFESCVVEINNVPISRDGSLYPYKYYIENLLSLSNESKTAQLSSELWYPDTEVDTFTASNLRYTARYRLTGNSKLCGLIGKISSPIFNQSRPIPNGCEIKVSLRRSQPEFVLAGSSSTSSSAFPYKIQFEHVCLWVKQNTINSLLLQKHQQMLSSGKRFQYPVRTNEVRNFAIATGTQIINSQTLYTGELPSYLVIGLVGQDNFTGSGSTSPFSFADNDLENVTCMVEGDTNMYRRIECDPKNNLTLLAYNTLFSALPDQNIGNGITRETYKKGNFLILLELMPNSGSQRFHIKRSGTLRISIKFSSALTSSVMCIVFASFQNLIQIDKDRLVYTNASIS